MSGRQAGRGVPAGAGRPAGVAAKGGAEAGAAGSRRDPVARPGTLAAVPGVLLAAALLLLVTRAALWLLQPLASEDAYIAFRYARNLVEGNGLAYNPGERVMGFTSLPWTLWCALGLLARVDPVVWTRAAGLAADLATLWLGWRVLAPAAGRASAGAFAVFFAGWPLFAAGAVSGLEVSALLALLFASAWWVSGGSRLAGPALGLLALLRPEGLVAALVLLPTARWPARFVALAVAGLGFAALAALFGSPVPQSVLAKADLYGTPGPWAGRHWWEWLSPFPVGRFPVAVEGQHLLPLAAVFLVSAVQGARTLAPQWRSPAALAAAAGVVVWLGYVALGVAYFWWYLVVPLGALGLLAAVGFPQLVRGRALLVAAALAVLGVWTVAIPVYVGRAQAEAAAFGPIADHLAGAAAPGETVLLEPIGLIGYRSRLRVLDESGLVSPAIAARRREGAGWYADVVARERPEWLVVRPDVLERGVAFAGTGAPFRTTAERDALLERYRVERPARPGLGQVLAIYRRVGEPSAPGSR
jgi:hypothetical protein